MGTILSRIGDIKAELEYTMRDADKFDDGNAAAAARVRKVLKKVMDDCKDVRKEIQTIKNKRAEDKKK